MRLAINPPQSERSVGHPGVDGIDRKQLLDESEAFEAAELRLGRACCRAARF